MQNGYSLKGKHIIQCQNGENKFQSSLSDSSCQPNSIQPNDNSFESDGVFLVK